MCIKAYKLFTLYYREITSSRYTDVKLTEHGQGEIL